MAKKEQQKIQQSGFTFLETLKQNNNREWFNDHKPEYLQELKLVEDFAEAMLQNLGLHDLIETPSGKSSLHRIYRDTRFSNNKTPYKTNWSGSFRRATKQRRGGYYFILSRAAVLLPAVFTARYPPISN